MKGGEGETGEASWGGISSGRLHKEQIGIFGSLLVMLERRLEEETKCAEEGSLGRS